MLTGMFANGNPSNTIEVGVEQAVGQITIGNYTYTVYRKIVDCGALPDTVNTYKYIPHGVTCIKFIGVSGWAEQSSGVACLPLPYVGFSTNNAIHLAVNTDNSGNIRMISDYNLSASWPKSYVVLEYYR